MYFVFFTVTWPWGKFLPSLQTTREMSSWLWQSPTGVLVLGYSPYLLWSLWTCMCYVTVKLEMYSETRANTSVAIIFCIPPRGATHLVQCGISIPTLVLACFWLEQIKLFAFQCTTCTFKMFSNVLKSDLLTHKNILH